MINISDVYKDINVKAYSILYRPIIIYPICH